MIRERFPAASHNRARTRTGVRYVANTIEEMQKVLFGYRDNMRVEVEPDIAVTAKTVGESNEPGRPHGGQCSGVATKALWRPGSSSERSLPPGGRLKDHGRNARGPSRGSTPLATWTA